MYEQYIRRDIACLKRYSVDGMDASLTAYDPSRARSSFEEMLSDVAEKNYYMIDTYKNSDRITGEYKSITYSAYDNEVS